MTLPIESVYVVHAMRFGNNEKHSYIEGVYMSKDAAIKAAEREEDYRGGKYGCAVLDYPLSIERGQPAPSREVVVRKPYGDRPIPPVARHAAPAAPSVVTEEMVERATHEFHEAMFAYQRANPDDKGHLKILAAGVRAALQAVLGERGPLPTPPEVKP